MRFQLVSDDQGKYRRAQVRYELNLVLNSGERLNVVSHGDPKRIREDASTLGEFLEKPVWDAT